MSMYTYTDATRTVTRYYGVQTISITLSAVEAATLAALIALNKSSARFGAETIRRLRIKLENVNLSTMVVTDAGRGYHLAFLPGEELR